MTQPLAPKTLVIYFSRSGHTRKVAEAIAHAAHADVEELREPSPRSGVVGWLRSGYEGTYRLSSHPLPLLRDPHDYQLVFIGSPTWNHALSSPVRGFLEQHGQSLHDVALFATCPEKGAEEAVAQMAELLPHPPLAVLHMRDADVNRGPAVEVGEFLECSLVAWERRHSLAGGASLAECRGKG